MFYDPKEEIVVKRILEIGGVVAGIVLIAFGIAAIVLGVNGKNTVGQELKLQQITGTSDMTPAAIKAEAAKAGLKNITDWPTVSVAGLPINSGDRARAFATYMRIHALEATHGFVYAQMGMYAAKPGTPKSQLTPDGATDNTQYAVLQNGQPESNAARNVWVTETALTTALNSSYMAEQMANFGIVVGVALLLAGGGFIILALSGALENEYWFFKRPAVKKAAEPKSTAPLGA
ncbi:MAG TPA: hypothetical protein VLW49_10330 [Gaiellaceae bacterium]|nr:hypothetical protein [Gaiellaceae bacterium]